MATTTRAEAKARTRTRLLDAAASVFAEKGFAGATVDQIAGRAGHTVGALYSNFSGKDELFLTLIEDHVAHHLHDVEQILATDQPGGHPAALGAYLVRTAERHRAWSTLESEFTRYALARPELREKLAERWHTPRAAIARIVCQAWNPAVDPSSVATVIIALFEGLLAQRRIDPAAVPESLFGDALTWLADGLAHPTTAPDGEAP
jgi:AcrR family transcriptional regulator